MGQEMYVLVDYNSETGEYIVEKKFIGMAGIAEANSKYEIVQKKALNELGKIIERKADGSTEIIEDYSTMLVDDKPLRK